MQALRGIDLTCPPNSPRDLKKSYKGVRARAGQGLIYFATQSSTALMNGFDELLAHYQNSIGSPETSQRSALVLLTVLFIIKYNAFEM
jgi:hypothetical protein